MTLQELCLKYILDNKLKTNDEYINSLINNYIYNQIPIKYDNDLKNVIFDINILLRKNNLTII